MVVQWFRGQKMVVMTFNGIRRGGVMLHLDGVLMVKGYWVSPEVRVVPICDHSNWTNTIIILRYDRNFSIVHSKEVQIQMYIVSVHKYSMSRVRDSDALWFVPWNYVSYLSVFHSNWDGGI